MTMVSHIWYMLLWVFTLSSLCWAKGGGGGDEEEVGKVTISQDPDVVILGGSVKFTCTFPTIADARTIYWFKSNDILYADTGKQIIHISAIRDRVYVPPNQDFIVSRQHIIHVQDLKITDGGKYQCQITRSEAHDFASDEGEIDLAVTPDPVTVEDSVPTKLTCDDHQSVHPLYWMKDNYFIVTNGSLHADSLPGYRLSGNSLYIKNVTSPYEGRYRCFSQGRRIHSWTVSILRPPVEELSALRGWRGILFGVALVVLILGTLGIACFIENRPFKDNMV